VVTPEDARRRLADALLDLQAALLPRLYEILGDQKTAHREFPFLEGVVEDLASRPPSLGRPGSVDAVASAAGLDATQRHVWILGGLVEEDSRWGVLFEALQGSGRARPSVGWIARLWPDSGRPAVRALVEAGLLAVHGDGPRADAEITVPEALWDALGGLWAPRPAPWARFEPAADQRALSELRLPEDVVEKARTADGAGLTLLVRGPAHNGRRALVGGLAKARGRNMLEVDLAAATDARWRLAGPLAEAMWADLVVAAPLPPGGTAEIARPHAHSGRLSVVAGRHGGLVGEASDAVIEVELRMPPAGVRELVWRDGGIAPTVAHELSASRLPTGTIRRAAELARASASASSPTADDLRGVLRSMHRATLETLATPLPPVGDWATLKVPPVVEKELLALERRCRLREQLPDVVGEALAGTMTAGVRALLSGPSGTGKTLAARILASVLGLPLYRLDLAAVVDKYIGETEKRLDAVLSRAEESDVVLLLDEGDALLARRTAVSSSNDRYANLETNYLLQRLGDYDGILVVTTNAADRIDTAFQRRMDTVVEFPLPDVAERLGIWRLHLPREHAVSDAVLADVATRCRLTGGVIRNAALHATLLALETARPVGDADVLEAVHREYRKLGSRAPLRGDG
jgi:hypothetical protein